MERRKAAGSARSLEKVSESEVEAWFQTWSRPWKLRRKGWVGCKITAKTFVKIRKVALRARKVVGYSDLKMRRKLAISAEVTVPSVARRS